MTSRKSRRSTTPRSVSALHPLVAEWFAAAYPGPSGIQQAALPHTLAGENTLILAPTGSGKTLAAFLSALSTLAAKASAGALTNAVSVFYVSPLKALDNDIHRNLEPALEAVNKRLPIGQQIRMQVRTGDTEGKQRAQQGKRRPQLMLTTPESLSTLLSQSGWRENGFAPETIIVDEIHSFAESKRGSLLALCMERLEQRSAHQLQRIGVSATAWPIEAIQRLLCGDRACAVASVDIRKSHRLEIVAPEPGVWLPPAGHNPFRVAPTVAKLIEASRCVLIFLTTRSAVERLALALNVLLPELDGRIAVHHGSINRAERAQVEAGLKSGWCRAVVATGSLELGVDFASVDHVILAGTPRGVSRALQRLGRSGHRVDGVAQGTLVPLTVPDLLEAVSLREAAREGRLDALRVPQQPLDVLAQVLLGMSIEEPWTFDDAFALVTRAGPYADLSRKDFEDVLHYLAGEGPVLSGNAAYGKIRIEGGTFRVADRKTARQYYMNAGVISADYEMKVVSKRNRPLGAVEESFIANLQPNEAFIMAGKPVRVKTVHQNMAIVEPAEGEQVKTPRWMGNKMPLTAQMAMEERKLRRELRTAWAEGGTSACCELLMGRYGVDANVATRGAEFIARHNRAMPVPTDSPVLAERIKSKRNLLILVHVVAGRAVNRSLAWVAGARLTEGRSVVANFDDHSFLLSMDARIDVDVDKLHEAFNPENWLEDLERTLSTTESLGRRFRHIAEIGQLLPRRTLRGNVSAKSATWSGNLLYKTLMEHEPNHPLLRESVREVLEDDCDAPNAIEEAARIYSAPLEMYDLPRPSPFGLPVFSAISREVLLADEPDRALDDFVANLYEQWASYPAT